MDKKQPIAVKILYKGRTPKLVELPVPYVSRSEKIGEVLCNPIGTFPVEHGDRLLEISGSGGPFQLVEYVYDEKSAEKELEKLPEEKTDQLMRPTWRKLLESEWNTRSAAEYHMRKEAAPFQAYRDEATGKWKLKVKNSAVPAMAG